MATRKVFIDEEDQELSATLLGGETLCIKIKSLDGEISVMLNKEDAKDFIMELYRLKRKIG